MNNTVYDAAIIGAGPAGVSCAVWLSLLGFNAIIIEKSTRIGGLVANNPYQDMWNVTAPELTGEDIAKQMKKSIDHARVPVLFNQNVTDIQLAQSSVDFNLSSQTSVNQNYKIFFSDNDVDVAGICEETQKAQHMIETKHIVIATGVRYKRPPEMSDRRYPQILIGPGKHVFQHDFVMREVAILGGGDNAMENAVYLDQRGAKSIDIYSRTIRAQRKWKDYISPQKLHIGDYKFDPDKMMVNDKVYDTILVFYGYEPRLDGLSRLGLQLQDSGHIYTDFKTAETNIPRIYAIGEVANRMHPCVVTSLADGVVAAKSIQHSLEKKV